MVKHYYPSRKIPKVVKVSIFQQVFGHRVLQEWFKKMSLHGVVPVIIGAAATLTGYFDMYVRSVAVMICAGWFCIDVGIWLAQTKSKFKEPIFGLCCGFICCLGMGIMYWFLISTLQEQQEDAYQNLSARAELPAPGDAMSSFFVISNGGKTRIGVLDTCGIHLIVGENKGLLARFGILDFYKLRVIGPWRRSPVNSMFQQTAVPICWSRCLCGCGNWSVVFPGNTASHPQRTIFQICRVSCFE